MASRVLIVEDEPDIRDLLAWHLEREGYRVARSGDGAQALREIATQPPDLILLDLMLPGMGGLEVCRRLRQDPATAALPVIMLTAKGDEVDRVVGLEVGADDYIVKPFSPKEVLARVRAVLRRTAGGVPTGRLASGTIALDPATHEVTAAGASLTLTPKEFDLLRALLEARGRVLTREFLLDRVWGYARAGELESRTVDVHVRRLRAKLGDEGRRILTVKNAGYRLEPGTSAGAGET
jgi:phosphate regulon transcriptional regulator PhoB